MDWDKERHITYPLLSQTKQTQLGEKYFHLLPIKIQLDGEKQRQNLKHLPFPSFQSQLYFFIPCSSNFCPCPQAVQDGMRNGGLLSVYNSSSLPLPPHTVPCSAMESFRGCREISFPSCFLPQAAWGISALVPAVPPHLPSSMNVFARLFLTLFFCFTPLLLI